ncbi:MAG: hypothetical protein WKF43_06430 [Acidimicrobiales bacterium]
MRIAVVTGSRHGSTQEIGRALAAELTERGHDGRHLDVRATVRAVHAPYGDSRDWGPITAWAADVATCMARIPH